MDFLNEGHSVFFEIRALYVRDRTGRLLGVEGVHAETISKRWNLLRKKIKSFHKRESLEFDKDQSTEIFELWPTQCEDDRLQDQAFHPLSEGDVVRLQELERSTDDVIGVVSIFPPKKELGFDRRTWATLAFLYCSEFHVEKAPCRTVDREKEARQYTDKIADLYERKLRITVADDKWDKCGREYFKRRVTNYTRRMKQVEFCLPAFPCKSSNVQKIAGSDPDLAEAIALWTLQSFAADLKEIYPPGGQVWIISDGHVFADCIGVDDAEVNRYSARLKELNVKVNKSCPSISFTSLPDAFFPCPSIKKLFRESWVKDVDVPHLVDTQRTTDAIMCRKLLMSCCQANSGNLKISVKDPTSPILALYRGFSKFMLEDLALHPTCQSISQSKRRKLSFTVAFEMIKRNQAYSNLVELIFPQHVRLSIHAHKNCGPKFGIGLLPKTLVRPIRSLEDRLEPESEDLLHTPTPWHNCLLRLENDPMLYLVKSATVHDALKSRKFGGGWVSPEGDHGCQGYYYLKMNQQEERASAGDGVSTGNYKCNAEEKIHIDFLKKEGLRVQAGDKVLVVGGKTQALEIPTRRKHFFRRVLDRFLGLRMIRWVYFVVWARAKVY